MNFPKYRAFIKSIKWMLPVEMIDFQHEEIRVDLADGQGADAEYRFDEIELMQWTGELDVDDAEIYDGDIVRYRTDSGREYVNIIIFEDGGFGSRLWHLSDMYEIKVLGNILEHPHLLEVPE